MNNKRLMLISDDFDIDREMLKEIFEDEFDIMEADNGRKCIELVKQYGNRISVILLDIQMPEATGLDVLEYRNTDAVFRNIPVIVITINDDTKSQMEIFQLGATDYITKPFIQEIIKYRVHNVLSAYNVEEIVRERESLRAQSELDLMTELYNKVTSERLIGSLLANNTSHNALMIVDIDDFKYVNDTHGHLTGDHTICAVAELLSGYFRKTDIIGRIGGDEFVVFMIGIPSKDLARQKADRFANLLKYQPNIQLPVNVTVSIGLTISDPRPYTYEELFKEADQALYQAKRNGKGQYAEYGVENKHLNLPKGIFVALLLSKNRETRSIINLINEDIRLLTISYPGEADYFKREFASQIQFLYIDISGEKDNGESLFEQMQSVYWLNDVPFVAICQEGNMEQYGVAIQKGAVDIIPAPVDVVFAKRRSENLYTLCRHDG